jgi:signal transduction histidine kinase
VRGTFAVTSISIGSFLVFVWYSIKKKIDFKTIVTIIFSIIFFAFSLTEYLVESVVVGDPSQLVPVTFNRFAFIFIAYILLGIVVLLISIVRHRNKIEGLDFLRLRYITTGMIVGGLTALITNVVIPAFTGTSASALFGSIAMSFISLFTTYSYIQNRLFGIKFLLNKVLFYLIPTFLLSFIFISTLYFFPELKLDFSNPATYVFITLLSFVLIILLPHLQNSLERKLSSSGDIKEHPQEIRDEFLQDISTELNLDKLGILTLKAIDKIFNLKKSGVIIFNADNASIIYKKLYEFGEQLLDNRNLLQVIYYWDNQGHSTTITKDELSNKKDLSQQEKRIFHFMEKDDIEVILPLNRKVHLNGVVVLGSKNSRNPFTVEDIKYLEALIINSSVAFSRSILYSQVKELNASLQQKVDLQTKELQKKVKQLEEARRKEADMIDIMGHELRTPMSIVKLNTDLLSNFSKNIPKRKEDFTKYVKRIKGAVNTEIKLINTLLSSAKLEGNQIDLKPEKVDITEKIKMSLDAYEERVEKRDLVLRTEFEPNTPSVYGDHARIVEILNNLIDNAVKYTEKGSVLVKTETEGDFVRTSVIDSGQGMSEDDLSRLGTKFFRTSNYISSQESDDIEIVRPGGTGLGLYVTFNLVKQMGGEIDVKSELGKGSNFSFTLPKYNGQKQTNNHESKDMFERLGLKKENSPTERIQQ